MEIDGVYRDEVVFSVMFPSTFASMQRISMHEEGWVLCAECDPDDVREIRGIEAKLLDELRNCSKSTFAGFRDEYDEMFVSSVVDPSSGGVEFRLDHPVDFPDLRADDCHSVDCSISPVKVTVRPGSAAVTWVFSPIEDPTIEIPGVSRASEAIAHASRARRAIERLEDRVKANVHDADKVIMFLERHKFLPNQSEVE